MLKNMLLLARSVLLVSLPLSAMAYDVARDEVTDKDDPEVVFAYQGDAVLTQLGIDAAFAKIPEEHRNMFIRDGGQVDRMVRNMMKTEVIALDAIANGFDQDPMVKERVLQAAYKELASAWIAALADRAPEADYQAMAYEDYLANPEDYRTEPLLDVTHILIGTESRSQPAALELAESVRVQILEGSASFEEMVMEYSDDPAKANNQGSYLHMGPGRMVEPFEDAAYALENPGDISEPVQTDYGYHIIRLDARHEPRQRTFEEVREEAVADMKARHQSEYREHYIKGLLEQGIVLPEGSVEVMLKRHFGENLERAPMAN